MVNAYVLFTKCHTERGLRFCNSQCSTQLCPCHMVYYLSRWFVLPRLCPMFVIALLSLCPTLCDLSLKLRSWPMVNRWNRLIWIYDHTSLPSVHAHLSYDVSHHNNSIREYPHVQTVRTSVTGTIPEDDKTPLIIHDAMGYFHFPLKWITHIYIFI